MRKEKEQRSPSYSFGISSRVTEGRSVREKLSGFFPKSKYPNVVRILLVALFLSSGCARSISENGFYYVYRVVDGDTIILANAGNIRYIGIDTPELRKKVAGEWVWSPQPYAVEALNLNKRLVDGKKIRLEFDNERLDRYGRRLAYVFVDDKMVNEELLRYGYATVYTRQPNMKYLNRLLAAEQQAKKEKRGIWSSGEVNGR